MCSLGQPHDNLPTSVFLVLGLQAPTPIHGFNYVLLMSTPPTFHGQGNSNDWESLNKNRVRQRSGVISLWEVETDIIFQEETHPEDSPGRNWRPGSESSDIN